MEPFPKRQRLFAPAHRDFAQSFTDRHDYNNEPADSEMVDEEEDFEEEAETENDPDTELQQRRARLDYKLKSTFEAIFEKYGKDFDGVGDEIDLATGEILVNNGHLNEMQDERDAGDVSRARNTLRAFTAEPGDMPSSSVGETDMLDEEEDNEEEYDEDDDDSMSGDDMVDDDMILRGFAKANRFLQASQDMEASPELPPQERRHEDGRHSSMKGNGLPSRSDILLQFGPQLGPHIAEYISQQQAPESPVPDDSHIEPAWRVPDIPFSRPVKRPVKKPITLAPEPERSPSPEAAKSIWAPAKSQRRLGVERRSRAPKKLQDALMIDPLSDPVGLGYDLTPEPAPKRIRKNFTVQDDQILLRFVEQVRRQNLEFSATNTWRLLEDMHPHHSCTSWKARYKLKYTYLWPEEGEEPESSETSVDTTRRVEQPNSIVGRPITKPPPPIQPAVQSRPSRIRKPAEKDSRIITWSQAVDAIELVDPDLHASILEDSRMMDDDRELERTVSSSFDQDTIISQSGPAILSQLESQRPLSRHQSSRIPTLSKAGEISSDFMAIDGALEPNQPKIPCAPCPHADCKALVSQVYRLQRQDEEDLSEMCLHLFHQHHITPFPCGEIDCSRKAEEGFFMQVDLVRHVRLSHPSAGALQRLRSRVNPELLDRHIELTRISKKADSPIKPDKRMETDFASPSQVWSASSMKNAHFSSSSGGDRTITPRRVSVPLRGAHSTPMTSISSMFAHPSSGTTVLPVRDSQSQETSRSARVEGSFDEDATIELFSGAFINHKATSSITPAQVLGTRQLSDPFQSDPARRSLPTPQASLGGSLGPSSVFPKKVAAGPATIRPKAQVNKHRTARDVDSGSKVPLPVTIPNSQSSMNTVPSSSFTTSSKTKTAKPVGTSESFFRPVDPSYAFSDEDEEPIVSKSAVIKGPVQSPVLSRTAKDEVIGTGPSHTEAKTSTKPSKPTQVVSPYKSLSRVHAIKSSAVEPKRAQSGPASISKTKAMPPPITPALKVPGHFRRSILPDSDDADDFDELSSEQFAIFTHPRTNPQPKTNPILARVKKGGNAKTPQVHSAPSRKRKLDVFHEPTANAEDTSAHSVPATAAPSSKEDLPVDPAIKIEVEDSTTLSAPLPKKVGRRRKAPVAPTPITKSPFGQLDQRARTGTPLLDLTPSRRKARTEVRDSDEEPSSPFAGEASKLVAATGEATNAEKRTAVLPRVLDKAWDKAPIVLRTPGGKLRKCGEDGFRCRKGFCFACGVESQERSMRKGNGKGKA